MSGHKSGYKIGQGPWTVPCTTARSHYEKWQSLGLNDQHTAFGSYIYYIQPKYGWKIIFMFIYFWHSNSEQLWTLFVLTPELLQTFISNFELGTKEQLNNNPHHWVCKGSRVHRVTRASSAQQCVTSCHMRARLTILYHMPSHVAGLKFKHGHCSVSKFPFI